MVEISAHTLKENMKEILDSNGVVGITRHGFLGHVIVPIEQYKQINSEKTANESDTLCN
jgi:antitoxin (DNA-binding transcriptional repressor) of toxin-antitoxin stability system